MEVDEVDHPATRDPVDKITDGAAQNQGERDT